MPLPVISGNIPFAMSEPRYVIFHGHFYQPPRQSPWTGLISREADAAPFANWNERILSECYAANGRAHSGDGAVLRVRNNYESLNFDFGPTLMVWLEAHGSVAYRTVRRGDELSVKARAGHGNAIAQSYNHSILPLLSDRDRELQIAWGVQDFVFRFGRAPEGIWLPECAADAGTLAAVAAAGLKFTILTAGQGRFIGARSQNGRGAGPFLWRDGSRSLAIFRADHELSIALSFGEGLADGARLVQWVADSAQTVEPGEALLLATDGETFGHHKKGGANELARAFETLERREDVVLTNCAEYLARHPAVGAFEIDSASSWSCPHGVERWRSNCGCRMDSATSQEWREPLREAMVFVKDHAGSVYDRFAKEVVGEQAWAVLKEAARLALEGYPTEQFMARYKVKDEAKVSMMVRLLELERAAHATLTSCAWFFDDFGGAEGRVALRWAARAVELAAEFSPSIESDLLDRLRRIRSNRRDIGDAATLYLSLKAREARGRGEY